MRIADTRTAPTIKQQLQAQTTHTGLPNVTSQQHYTVAGMDFSAVNSQQSQPSGSLGPPQSQFSGTSYAHPTQKITLPIIGRRKCSSGINSTLQDPQSTWNAACGDSQGVQNTAPPTRPSFNQHSQHRAIHAGSSPGEYIETATSDVGASAAQQDMPQVLYLFSSEGSDADDKDDESDEDDDSDESHEDHEMDDDEDSGMEVQSPENDGDDEVDKYIEGYGDEEPDPAMLLAEEVIQGATLPAEVRRQMMQYYRNVESQRLMCLRGKISVDELESRMREPLAELTSGLKRARWDDGDDDEVEQMQSRRAKRTRRGGDVAGSGAQPLGETLSPPLSGFESPRPGPGGYRRRGWSVHASQRPTSRPAGSAVQRLHQSRLRGSALKAI